MPLNRHQIRNEYSLADPELYKVADKDDPEALLEGVAMAGLVGVLRQLGDLAEFAAEIFHDLHEEVMATSARGHGLIVRVQQLEAEFPSIERTLLSQTSHTALLYNAGVDWHPNLRMDQSVVTREDLPRFVMDSYEECRGPPRLFLLDKFDVAGAGACLKRFTDPSFFKMESTTMTGRKLDGQRDKKTRRVKKRGPRWRNGETPESYPSSHAKLHQLFLEERIESGINDPARRVKLKKRQFSGSLFEQDNVKSYMEKFLDTSLQEQRILHEICIDPLALTWTTDVCEAGLEVVEIGAISPVKESMQTDKNLCSSLEGKDMFKSSLGGVGGFNQDKLNILSDNKSTEVPELYHESHDNNLSTISKEVSSDQIADRESMSEGNADAACDFDDVASEIDNYVDALANIESELETDSDCKKIPHYLNVEPVVADSDGSEKLRELHSVSFDSRSIGNSITSEDGDHLSRERESSCSNSVNTLMETTPELDVAVNTIQASNSDSDNMVFDHHSTYEEILRNEREMHAAASIAHAEVDDLLKSEEFGEALNTSSLADSNKAVLPVDTKARVIDPLLCPEQEDSAKLDVDLGETDQGHTKETGIFHSHRKFSDTTDNSGPFVSAEPSVHDKDGPYCSSLNNSDSVVRFLETDSHDSAGSLVEGPDTDFGAAELNACSDNESSGKHFPLSVPICQEKTKSIVVAREDCTPTGNNSKDLYSATDSTPNFGLQELLPGTKKSGHASLDYSAENLPDFWEDPSMDDGCAVSKEIVSFALHGCQPEKLPSMSNQLHTSARAEITEATKLPNCGSFEADTAIASSRDDSNSEISWSADKISNDSFMEGKPSPILGPLEKQSEWLTLPSEETGGTLLELLPNDSREVYSSNVTGSSVSVDGNQDKTQAFVPDTVVDDHEPQAAIIHVEASIDHAPDASPLNIPCEHTNDSGSVAGDLDRDVGKVKHLETVADGSEQVVMDDCHQNGTTLPSTLSQLPESPLLVTEQFYQSDEELTKGNRRELTEQEQNDPVRDASVTSNANMRNMSSADSPSLHSGSLPEDKSSGNLAAEVMDLDSLGHALFEPQNIERESSVDAAGLHNDDQPTLSKISPQSAEHTLDTSNVFVHGNGMLSSGNQASQLENSGHPSRINLEPPSLPPLPPMQWRLSKFQNSAAAPSGRQVVQHARVPVQVQPMGLPALHHTLAPVQPVPLPAAHHTIASFQPVTLASGNSTLVSIPPTILPLAPPAVHYAYSPLQPVILPTSDYRTEINSRTLTNEGQLGYSDGYVAQQGVFTLPMPVGADGLFQFNTSAVGRHDSMPSTVPSIYTNSDSHVTQQGIYTPSNPFMVSEDYFHTKTSEVERQDHVPITVPTASTSLNDTQISEESCQPNVDPPESGSLVGHFSEDTYTLEEKVNTEASIQNELVGDGPQVSDEVANSCFQPLVDQAPPSLVAPEAGRTWSSAYDENPYYADGNINGTHQKKPARPRNPLIVEVVSIDKSKLRKVERTKPQLESKPEEGESVLEQMQLRKVERVKPPVESKEEGGEYLLEQLQLRKVGERVKPPVEPKTEEEFLPEQLQLRKVGDRVKSPVEPKPEEREFLLEQLQLRKVGVKPQKEAEPKVEETNSPMAHLRKVRERVREELDLKAEETESPRMLLRKVTERSHPPAEPKAEERDSLFEQIRNKSFNLKPAVAARPNIQGPRTNLKVAAILEKASTIRQAMAGSDEDEDGDSWSDS